MSTAATRRDPGNEPTHATAPTAAYVGLFREPQYTIDLPPLDDDDAVAPTPAPAGRPSARG